MRKLTFGGTERNPIWSADGERVTFQSESLGDGGIFWQRVDGSGSPERLTTAAKGVIHVPDSWSPDGKHLSFTKVEGVKGSIWIYSTEDKKATLFAESPAGFIGRSIFSPDGHWLAYQSNETKRNEVFVQPFPVGNKYQISKDQDSHHPVWSRDGKRLLFIPGSATFVAVDISTTPGFSFSNPVPLPKGFLEGGPTAGRNYDIMPDGNILGVIAAASEGQADNSNPPADIRIVLNWFTELQQRVLAK
jgi:eukaryotic-like serine/threonine-protein kinase